jgi:hypothetical protein
MMHIFHGPVNASFVGSTQFQFLLDRLPVSTKHYLADIYAKPYCVSTIESIGRMLLWTFLVLQIDLNISDRCYDVSKMYVYVIAPNYA